ncbi:hypothetical protein EBR56_04805, partial [bacterium]|nr:hypothetical protein [bacterium]
MPPIDLSGSASGPRFFQPDGEAGDFQRSDPVVHSFASVWRALLGCACAIGLAGVVPGATPEPPDFTKQIQPILAEHCAHCHGLDESTRQGGLRLDIRQNALEG